MKKILPFVVGMLCSLQISGQVIFDELVSSSGDCYETPIIIFSWSLGECVTETLVDNSIMISQGFHQSCSFKLDKIVDAMYKGLEVTVYPNPATNYLEVKISKELDPLDGCFIELYDINGNCLLKKEILSHNETLILSSFNVKSLVIRILKNDLLLKSITIQRIY